MNVSEILSRLSKLSDQQLTQISTPLDLKQSITGILCREQLLLDALTNKIHQKDTFKKEFSKSKDNAMIKYVVNRLKNNQSTNPEENLKVKRKIFPIQKRFTFQIKCDC